MSSVLDIIKRYQHTIEKYPNEESKLLRSIEKLHQLNVTVRHLEETGVGRTVNALRKEPGQVGEAARALVKDWKHMVAAEEKSEPEDYNSEVQHYNGHGSGGDSDRESTKKNQVNHTNGDHKYKRKYHSSEEEVETDRKRARHSSSSPDSHNKYDRKPNVDSKSDYSDSGSDDDSNHESQTSDSDMSENTEEEQDVKVKIEPTEKNTSYNSSKKLSEERTSDYDRKKSHETYKHTKDNKLDHKKTSEKSSSKERSSNSHHKQHSEKENISDKKYKSSSDKSEKSSSSKHSGSTEKCSSKDREDKHKHKSSSSGSQKYESKSDKSHKSDESKHKHLSDKELPKEKEKDKDRHKSSKDKHVTSDKYNKDRRHMTVDTEKNKHKSSSSEKFSHSSRDEKKHSSSSESKSKSSDSKSSSSKDKNKHSSSSTSKHHKSSSSSSNNKRNDSKFKEDSPKKSIAPVTSEDEDGIGPASGTSFAEALGMISPTKPIKKKTSSKDASNSSNDDLSPAALLAPTAKLAPLPPLEISALPEISPNYRPRPPPKLLTHLNEDDAINAGISSKNQRTKVYSGNKTVGKVYSLYELCVQVLQEHIDSLEYTGGVPYEILKPIVDRANPDQLFMLEHYNPYLMEDTDHLWKSFCEKRFRNKKRQEMESFREMYIRCQDEQEHKLKSLTANIKMAQDIKNAPVKQTKMAYVDSVVKPPRNVARKQAIHGTARATQASPAARVASLAAGPHVARPGAPRIAAPSAAAVPFASLQKPKKAPLMQKALQFMRGRKR